MRGVDVGCEKGEGGGGGRSMTMMAHNAPRLGVIRADESIEYLIRYHTQKVSYLWDPSFPGI